MLAASRVGKDCKTYKWRKDWFSWIDYNENTQGTVNSFFNLWNWSFSTFIRIFCCLVTILKIGYGGNRETNKRWSQINGSWRWPDQVAYSFGGNISSKLFLIFVLDQNIFFRIWWITLRSSPPHCLWNEIMTIYDMFFNCWLAEMNMLRAICKWWSWFWSLNPWLKSPIKFCYI